ncbi:PREDICTED: binding partner of ACD11 1 [Erythranthe guttata]|uniref:binding partner of ACD11 1 n=1 Tax=Erythranthe guttata TaxID=4155 RepID=UPI00064DCF33|nr:PREDICTED: binding partner of ACD11 1 [Erythranthe guttata]|eukprot:XP_012845975.1 PREDICTED: binding partner of ACD11 1 [Erythranthe guttata]
MELNSRKGESLQPISSPNWTIDVSDVRLDNGQIRTVKVSNVSLAVSERDIFEFFTFSGEIQYIEMQRETETTQVSYITFSDSQGADTATLLTGSTIAGLSVSITPTANYQLPPNAPSLTSPKATMTGTAVKKTEEVVSTMLAKGFVLGKDALNRAKSFDDKHHLSSNASATVASIDHRIGLSEKLSMGTAMVNEKVKEMDELLQVSEITKSAFAAAEQKASSIMSNRYVSTGASWVTSALSAVSKAAEDVGVMTKEKVERAEEEKKERGPIIGGSDFTNTRRDESPAIVVCSVDESNKIV